MKGLLISCSIECRLVCQQWTASEDNRIWSHSSQRPCSDPTRETRNLLKRWVSHKTYVLNYFMEVWYREIIFIHWGQCLWAYKSLWVHNFEGNSYIHSRLCKSSNISPQQTFHSMIPQYILYHKNSKNIFYSFINVLESLILFF